MSNIARQQQKVRSECSPTASMRSVALARRVFDIVSGSARSSSSTSPLQNRRIFHGDVERDEFQSASSHCLSSHYSVFVARLAIMVMLTILIGLLTGLTWHFTRTYTTRSINSLAYGLRHELLQRPVLKMWSVLNSTVDITTAQVKLSEVVIRKYYRASTQAEQVEMYETMRDVTWALFSCRKSLNAITINYKNGFVQAFHRDHRRKTTFYMYSDLKNYSISGDAEMLLSRQEWTGQDIHSNTSAKWYRVPVDPITGERTGKPFLIPPDDLINIAGISQVPDGVASWDVTVSKFIDSPLLSAALPVWDPAKEEIVAVVGVTTALSSVGQLMKEIVEFHSGYIYLTSQDGNLLATSTNAPLLTNSTGEPKLVKAANSENQVIQQGAEWLRKTNGDNILSNQEVHVANAKLGHQEFYIDSFFLNLTKLPMVGVIIIPRKYITGRAEERALKTLIILISAAFGILVIGCISIFILTNGVSKEMKLRAELISHLDARRRAEASNTYKSQFLANMSHELRTPMAAVIGLLDILLSDECLTKEQHDTVTQIRKCSTALLRLLNNILDLSKVESGKLILEEAEFDLRRDLEALVDMFSVQCINHNVETILDLSDDMPRLVQGDSARIIQIFANLLSNSIKFTSSGHIILRGWCENLNTSSYSGKFPANQKDYRASTRFLNQRGDHTRFACRKAERIIMRFEVDDSGCGIDSSKWESVFDSFEQADASTTRTHGGTGLGLCIVRSLVQKMGGEIKVVKKNGPGTLMQLHLLLRASLDTDKAGQHPQMNFGEDDFNVLLALSGGLSRQILSNWLKKNGVTTWEASDWNQLMDILSYNVPPYRGITRCGIDGGQALSGAGTDRTRSNIASNFIVVIDITLLDLKTDIWKEQLNHLSKFMDKANFAWMLNHDTSNIVKIALRQQGHVLTVNKPLYQGKVTQIFEAVMKKRIAHPHNQNADAEKTKTTEEGLQQCFEIDYAHSDTGSSDGSEKSEPKSSSCAFENGDKQFRMITSLENLKYPMFKDGSLELNRVSTKEGNETTKDMADISHKLQGNEGIELECDLVDKQKPLEGLCILLAEDTVVLQRVATIMLEKMGATVNVVEDGLQAVNAFKSMFNENMSARQFSEQERSMEIHQNTISFNTPSYDLILMDCQMPKMDGYEATKAIRESEIKTGEHIPIVALTAHAMSSDEAKCLEVGMDAYLTKPIDCKLMVSTILSLTKRTA
uniref:histidine kinase n=1 Tax=Kalanchoe fedtschenkoi TaxID=63787 RepID=A0A7N0V0U9_KALFE